MAFNQDTRGLHLEMRGWPTGRTIPKSTRDYVRELCLCCMAIASKAAHEGRRATDAELMWIHDASQWIYKYPCKTTERNLLQASALINNFHSRFL